MFSPYAHVHALNGLPCRARATLASTARMPRPARARRRRRLRTALRLRQSFFAHTFGPCRKEKTYGIIGTSSRKVNIDGVE